MPDSDLTLSTLSDVTDYTDSRWRPPKPEIEIIFERNELATRCQGLPDICDHAGLVCDTGDTARRWLVKLTGI